MIYQTLTKKENHIIVVSAPAGNLVFAKVGSRLRGNDGVFWVPGYQDLSLLANQVESRGMLKNIDIPAHKYCEQFKYSTLIEKLPKSVAFSIRATERISAPSIF